MSSPFWSDLASQGPISALAPMDGYCDSPYRRIVKKIAPKTVVFSEFYSADGLVHSKDLQKRALTHDQSEYPLIIQIFGKDPEKFTEAAKIIESYGITGIDINMGCPAKKVVKSGHGSSLMINRDTAFRIVESMAQAVKIPISVKTRLGWEDHSLLIDFCQGLERAGANLITVHGRTYKQAFTGKANFEGIYALKQSLRIPVLCNGDITSYDDGIAKIIHPKNRTTETSDAHTIIGEESISYRDLDGFMIGRSSFGNPWCFLEGGRSPPLSEILETMSEHGRLLSEQKGRKGMMEARKHLVEYLHGFPRVKEYRSRLVQVESLDDIERIIETIRTEHVPLLGHPISHDTGLIRSETWGCVEG